jgi:hypothetical protein
LISRGWESTVSQKRYFFLLILEWRRAVPKRISSLAATEEGAAVTQKYKSARSNEYATSSDFCRIYVEQMNSLYLLSLLLTADPQKAERCFLSGFEESVNNNSVFKERGHLWARRSIVFHAIRLLCPRPNDENESNEARPSPPIEKVPGTIPAEVSAYPDFARIIGLNAFERFIFIMSILEKYSDQECSLLLGCFRRDVIDARTAAIRHLANVVIATETQPEREVSAFAGINYANR